MVPVISMGDYQQNSFNSTGGVDQTVSREKHGVDEQGTDIII